MKSYLDLIPISAKVHKKQNRMTLWCIILAVFLVTVIFSMADMELRGQKIKAVKDYGNWHIMLKHITDEEAQMLAARPDVAASSWYEVLNYRLKDAYSIEGKQTVICGFEQELLTDIMTGTEITEGEYPPGDEHILLTENARDILSVRVGDQITLDTPSGSPSVFTVSGFSENTSMITKADALGVFMTTSAFKDIWQKENNTQLLDVDMVYYIQFAEHQNIRSSIAEIKEYYGLEDENISQNTALLGVMGQSSDSYMMGLYAAAFILFLLVLTAGVLMIASSLNSNIARRTEFFGMLRCIGAGKRQIIRFVRLEALCWCKTAIPAGVAAGVVSVWALCAVLRFLSAGYFGEMPIFGISVMGILAGIVVGLLTVLLAAQAPAKRAAKVPPFTAVSGNATSTQKIRRAANTRFYKISTALGIHHAVMSKKNFVLMTASFALSIILFLSFSAAVEFMHHAIRPLKPYTPDLSVVSPENACSISPGIVGDLEQKAYVKQVYGRMFSTLPVEIEKQKRNISLVSYEQCQFQWAEDSLLEGSVKEAEEGSGFVLAVYDPQNPIHVGNRLRFQNGEVTVSGILSDSPFDAEPGVGTVICSENTFQAMTGEKNYTVIDIQLSKNASEHDVNEIRELAGANTVFSDRRLSNQEAKGAYWSMALFIYGFLTVIALITVFNIINSISMSVSARVKQYGAMRAIGMSDRQMFQMITAEAITYGVTGSLMGCILGLPIHKYLFESFVTAHWGDSWQLPLPALAIIVLLVIISSSAAVYRPARQICGASITNTISAQ